MLKKPAEKDASRLIFVVSPALTLRYYDLVPGSIPEGIVVEIVHKATRIAEIKNHYHRGGRLPCRCCYIALVLLDPGTKSLWIKLSLPFGYSRTGSPPFTVPFWFAQYWSPASYR